MIAMRPRSVFPRVGIKILSLLTLLIFPLKSFPALSLLLQAATQASLKAEVSTHSQLIGTGEPQIQVLQGFSGAEGLVRIFQGAKWFFYPDGKFVFVPSENANVRHDLYPIIGTYQKNGDIFEFQAEGRSSITDASTSVDGVIQINKDQVLLEATRASTAGVSRQIARISQTLSPASQVAVQSPKRVEKIKFPSSYKISLQGQTESSTFEQLSAILKILPPTSNDPNPLLVSLSTELHGNNGSISWSSFVSTNKGQQEPHSRISVDNNQVRLEVNPTEKLRLDVSWFTLIRGGLEQLVGSLPIGATVKQGMLTFSIQDNSISGSIKADGTSDFGNPSHYEATFTGQLIQEDFSFSYPEQLQTTEQAETSSTLFDGSWTAEPWGTIKLRQNEQHVSGTYSGRGGGSIEGVVEGTRLNFTWKDDHDSGWGFSRAIANGTTLVGMWENGTEKTDGNSLIANQIKQTAPRPKLSPTNNQQADRDSISTQTYKKDDLVEVLWQNTWWPAKVLEVKGENYCITYVGWDSSWDECVASNRIRPVAKTAEAEAERLYRVGFNHLVNKNYIQAVEHLEESIEITENQKLDNAIIQERALNAISLVYAILGDYEKLKEYAEKHLEIANQLYDPSAATIALVRIASFYFDREDYKTAELKLLEAVSRSKNIAPYTGGFALSALGKTYLAMGKIEKAIAYLEEALKIGDPEVRVSTLEGLGQAYIILENYKKAIGFLEENRMIAKQYQGLFDVSIEANALNNLGYAFFKAGDLSKAEDALRKAVELWESQRNILSSNDPLKVDPFKVSIFELQALSYGTLQKVLVLQDKPEAALEVAEQGRARAFAYLLAQRLSPKAVEQITSKVPNPNIEKIREIAKTQNATLVEYSLIDSSPRFATPGKVLATELLIWVVQPTGEVALHQLDLKELQMNNISDLVSETRQSILTEQVNPGNDSSPQLKELHKLLIAPIAKLLPKDPDARVIFIPHRELFNVSFPALLDANDKYLIEKHTISIAPSIQILDSTHQLAIQNRGLAQDNLIVGNPRMPLKKESEKPLEQLPNEEIQAQEIAALLNTKAIVREWATKENIIQRMSKARIIHLGTHSQADNQEGLKSWIALAPSANDDGYLTAEEIFKLFTLPQGVPLHAELIVLSACQTGRGKITGDGVIGLSRSLIAAGIPSAVISLWSVDANSSILLMREFYENLQQNPDKAQALSQAMRTAMKQYPQPGDWAAFTLIGEAN